MKVKVLPLPSVLSTPYPAAVVFHDLAADGQPQARAFGVVRENVAGTLEFLEDQLQVLIRDADPVSDTDTTIWGLGVCTNRAVTSILPPWGVNLMEFERTLVRTWTSRSLSPTRAGRRGSIRMPTRMLLLSASDCMLAMEFLMTSSTDNSVICQLNLPASILVRSRMSLMSRASRSVSLLMTPRSFCCRSMAIPGFMMMSSAKALMDVRGVRSS